ncbi:hypothetical protein FHY11_001178 [Xanthomonas arboricola]|uniref:hypothetical protein n=1 Tax=Xanthomonas euroxanthea TaxID=2259622 RepID=UPI00141A91A1|nr:hypothetical protein [Xanthomonas euroxanthea]NIK07712.1 hypothetical protein [Xanthomonas euroxanthea]
MSMCVALQPDGTLIPTGQPVAECSGYVLVSSAEHGVYEVVQQVFQMPDKEVALGWFAGTLSLIVFLYVACRLAGSVANIFHDTRP